MNRPKFMPSPARMPTLAAIQRKLDAWELDHLRQHAAELQAANEQLRDQVARLTRDLHDAEDRAEHWQDDFVRLMDSGATLGLTTAGHIVAMQAGATQ